MSIFTSTRGGEYNDAFSLKESILNPRANHGGLHTLTSLPTIPSLGELLDLDYSQLTEQIFSLLGFRYDALHNALKTYAKFDFPQDPAPINAFSSNLYLQELYHGPSRAFKDMALQPLGELFSQFALNQKYLILSATSGDTGPATLESFKNKENIQVVCLYPMEGTSDVQRLQMTTQDANNLKVIPIIGNFDDAQTTIKNLLSDEEFISFLHTKQIQISAANSVNFGRIAFQIIYHIWAYLSLVRKKEISLGEKIKIIIPSGNFGNALGAFYAKLMGIPFEKIVIASNPNNILTEFISHGIYDISSKKLIPSYSPAMDILRSSNIERVLYALFGNTRTKTLMNDLNTQLHYKLTEKELELLQNHFQADFCTDEQCLKTIKEVSQLGKIIDPHTANAYFVAKKLDGKKIICSTAEWSKFAPTIVFALCGEKMSDQLALNWIKDRYKIDIPPTIEELFSKKENACHPLKPSEVKNLIKDWINTSNR